ncbi:MAG: type I restriction endonuclease subunit R, partial [Bacteroidota bacterium]
NNLRPIGNTKDDVRIYYDYKTGIVAPPEYNPTTPTVDTASEPEVAYRRATPNQLSIFELVERRNQAEEEIEVLIDDFREKIEAFYAHLEDPTNRNCTRLVAKIRDTSGAFEEEEVFEDFSIEYRRYVRRRRRELSDFFKRESADILRQLFDDFEGRVKASN